MKFFEIFIDEYINESKDAVTLQGLVRVNAGGRIFKARFKGPAFLNRNAQLGPDVIVGKYTGINENCYVARSTVGAYCAFGARTAINPFNHPTNWLSIHEFQYMPTSYDWVEEYREFRRLSRTPDMLPSVIVGNDVWMGHNAIVMGSLTVGDGAVIGAGSVVTKDVPPYAIVTGAPAEIRRLRFPERTIERLLASKWWDLELSQLSGFPFRDVDRALDLLERIRAGEPVAVS